MQSKSVYLFYFALSCIAMSCQQKNILPEKIVIDTYHGQEIEDPYRYAEDLQQPEVLQWIDKENAKASAHLESIANKKDLIDAQQKFDQGNSFTISKTKITANNYHFYLKRTTEDNVPKLYYRQSYEAVEQLLYDPKDFKPETGSEYVINYIQPSWDGSTIAVALTEKGKEIAEIITIDAASKKVSDQIITNTWPSSLGGISWLPDNSGFMYVHYNTTDVKSMDFAYNRKTVIYHLGKDPKQLNQFFSKENNPSLGLTKEDTPVVSFKNPNDQFFIGKTPGGRSYYNAYALAVKDISKKAWKPLFTKQDQVKSYIVKGDSLVYRTSKNAPNFKICKTSIANPNFENPIVLVEEKEDKVITDFDITSEGLYYVTSKNGVQAQLFKKLENTEKEVVLPQVYGSINIAAKGYTNSTLFITANGWATDSRRFKYEQDKLIPRDLNPITNSTQFEDIVVQEIEVPSHDGAMVPLSLFYKKGTTLSAKNRVLMDGYGAYGISMKPSFSFRRFLWVQAGGVYAVAHVRGGGEKGDAWHKDGYKTKKSNSWKDFIACAEYLINNQITTKDQLAIWSGSAGGILIGRAITERPDLFKAAMIEFGSLNMLRSELRANAASNIKEFGAMKNPEEFEGLLEMDAYHHIKKGEKYPATLLTAGLNDARVPAWFTVKFGARMQAANTSNTENLVLIDKDSGHGLDDTKTRNFERFATIIAFALWQTGHPDFQPE